jgi:hypothetical protein
VYKPDRGVTAATIPIANAGPSMATTSRRQASAEAVGADRRRLTTREQSSRVAIATTWGGVLGW